MAARAPLIPYLRNVKLWIWLAYLAGFAAFFGLIALRANGWLFLLPLAMLGYGIYVAVRYWRCPQCGLSLPTKYPVPVACRRCAGLLRLTAGGR